MNTEQKARAWVAKVENGETGTDTYGIVTALLAQHEALLCVCKSVLASETPVNHMTSHVGRKQMRDIEQAIALCEKEHET